LQQGPNVPTEVVGGRFQRFSAARSTSIRRRRTFPQYFKDLCAARESTPPTRASSAPRSLVPPPWSGQRPWSPMASTDAMTAEKTAETTGETDATTGVTAAKRGSESGRTSNKAVASTPGALGHPARRWRERDRIADRESRTAETTAPGTSTGNSISRPNKEPWRVVSLHTKGAHSRAFGTGQPARLDELLPARRLQTHPQPPTPLRGMAADPVAAQTAPLAVGPVPPPNRCRPTP
jgi:hypothetical protein